jgi:hypothetical protein
MTQTYIVNDDQSQYIDAEPVFHAKCKGGCLGKKRVHLALMTPVDMPVALVKVGEDGEDDSIMENWLEHEHVLRLLTDELAKVDLNLLLSAVTLTVQGDWKSLCQKEPEEDLGDDFGDDQFDASTYEEPSLYEMLIQVKYEDAIYGLYMPLNPLFFVAKYEPNTGCWKVANHNEAEALLLKAQAIPTQASK